MTSTTPSTLSEAILKGSEDSEQAVGRYFDDGSTVLYDTAFVILQQYFTKSWNTYGVYQNGVSVIITQSCDNIINSMSVYNSLPTSSAVVCLGPDTLTAPISPHHGFTVIFPTPIYIKEGISLNVKLLPTTKKEEYNGIKV